MITVQTLELPQSKAKQIDPAVFEKLSVLPLDDLVSVLNSYAAQSAEKVSFGTRNEWLYVTTPPMMRMLFGAKIFRLPETFAQKLGPANSMLNEGEGLAVIFRVLIPSGGKMYDAGLWCGERFLPGIMQLVGIGHGRN